MKRKPSNKKALLALGSVAFLSLTLFSMHVVLNAPRHTMHKQWVLSPPERWECRGDPVAVEALTAAQSAQDAIDAIDTECGGVTGEQIDACDVPNIVHFTLDNAKNFGFYAYVAVKSVHDRINPDNMYIHLMDYPIEEMSEYLDRAIREFGVTIVQSRKVTAVFDRPVEQVTHFSDIVRIETVIRFGGIYLDLDAYVLQPVDKFYKFETTIPSENDSGLASGVMIAKRCSRFLRTWYNMYDTFDDSQWGYHPIILPWKIAHIEPDHINIERAEIKTNFETFKKCFHEPFNPAYWKHVRIVHPYVRSAEETYDEQTIQHANNTFGILMRRILANKPGMSDDL